MYIFQENSISKETRDLLSKIMEPDYKVYNHFKSKFEKEVGKFGNTRMKTEIARLHDANEKRTKECNFKSRDNSQLSGKFKWWGNAELVGYLVSSKSCFSWRGKCNSCFSWEGKIQILPLLEMKIQFLLLNGVKMQI